MMYHFSHLLLAEPSVLPAVSHQIYIIITHIQGYNNSRNSKRIIVDSLQFFATGMDSKGWPTIEFAMIDTAALRAK